MQDFWLYPSYIGSKYTHLGGRCVKEVVPTYLRYVLSWAETVETIIKFVYESGSSALKLF